MRRCLALLLTGCLLLPSPVSAGFWQVFPSGENTPNATTNQFNTIGGGTGWNNTENNRKGLAAASGILSRLRVTIASAVGAGTSLTITVRLDAANTALSCVFNDDVTITCLDTDEVAVTAGQELTIASVVSGSPATTATDYSVVFIPDTANLNMYNGGSSATNLATGATNYLTPHSTDTPTTTEFLAGMLMPFAGSIEALYVELSGTSDNGAGADTYALTVRVNATTNSDCTCTISDAITCNDTACSTAFNAGDYLTISSVPGNTPAARLAWWGVAIQPDVPGQFGFMLVADTMDAANTTFNRVMAGHDSSWSTTGANRDEEVNTTVAEAIYVNLSGDPDNGAGTQSYAVNLRDDGSDTDTPTCTVSDGASSCNQTGQSYELEGGSIVVSRVVPANTPTVRDGQIAYQLMNTPRRVTGGGD